MDDIRRILVVTRSIEHFQEAVHCGIVLAKRHKAKLYIILAIYNPFGLKGWTVPLPSHVILEEEYENMQQEVEEDLHDMINAERADNVHIDVLIRTGQMVNKEISRVLKEKKIDLLIMYTHKEWHLEHFLFGGNQGRDYQETALLTN